MVRVISVSNLGYDYGGNFSDPEVDGVNYVDAREEEKLRDSKTQDPQDKAQKATPLKGGRKSG